MGTATTQPVAQSLDILSCTNEEFLETDLWLEQTYEVGSDLRGRDSIVLMMDAGALIISFQESFNLLFTATSDTLSVPLDSVSHLTPTFSGPISAASSNTTLGIEDTKEEGTEVWNERD